ncbi:MAG: hypothetical protein JXA13_15535 [Anaerolineales bacterium]|nr:hypothetical protein [Anaerolineales bacterium]
MSPDAHGFPCHSPRRSPPAKKYFRERRIRFKDVDVSRDMAALRDKVRRSGQPEAPVIDIGGKIVVGSNRPKIDKYLGL